MNFVLTRFDNEEIPLISELWYRSWLSSHRADPGDVSAAALATRIGCEGWDMWVARIETQPVAFLALDRPLDQLAQMFVDPAFQGKGIGAFLLEHSKSQMIEGFWLRTAKSNTGARRFYERNGLMLEKTDAIRAYYVSGDPECRSL